MTAIDIRPVVSNDFSDLKKFSHRIETIHTWQMEDNIGQGAIQVGFKRIRLPRSFSLEYPRPVEQVLDHWKERDLFLVARMESNRCAYLSIDLIENQSGRIVDLVVDEPYRRHGVATALIIAAQGWLKSHGISCMNLEVSLKNEAAIGLAEKLGFVFSGFMDGFFHSREIAFFFSLSLRQAG
jgi:GNAT superfamily N-acetyltransferase